MSDYFYNEIMGRLDRIERLLHSQQEVLNMDDVAFKTGLTRSTIYKLCWAKKIPYYKAAEGKNTYFKRSEIEEWMLTYKIKQEN